MILTTMGSADTLQALAAHLRPERASDPAAFAAAIAAVLDHVSTDKIAREFSAARATVERWRTGEAVPGVFARRAILERLRTIYGPLVFEQNGVLLKSSPFTSA